MIIPFFLLLTYRECNQYLKPIQLDDIHYVTADEYYYGCDDPRIVDNILIITGWMANRSMQKSSYVNHTVLLINEEGEYFEIKTSFYERGLTSYFNDGNDYTYGGVIGKCPVNYLKSGEAYGIAFIDEERDGTTNVVILDKKITV